MSESWFLTTPIKRVSRKFRKPNRCERVISVENTYRWNEPFSPTTQPREVSHKDRRHRLNEPH